MGKYQPWGILSSGRFCNLVSGLHITIHLHEMLNCYYLNQKFCSLTLLYEFFTVCFKKQVEKSCGPACVSASEVQMKWAVCAASSIHQDFMISLSPNFMKEGKCAAFCLSWQWKQLLVLPLLRTSVSHLCITFQNISQTSFTRWP